MAVALEEVWGRVKNVCKQNGLLILSVLAVVIGCLLGFFLRGKQLSEQVGSNDRCSNGPPHASPASPAKLFIFPNHLLALLPLYPLSVIPVSLNTEMNSNTIAYVKENTLFPALNDCLVLHTNIPTKGS